MEVGREGCAPERRMEADPGRARASCRTELRQRTTFTFTFICPFMDHVFAGYSQSSIVGRAITIIGRVPKRSSLPDARSVSCANKCAR